MPAKLATRVRMLSTGHGRKNDDADAVSVGIAALSATGLRSAAVEEAIIAPRAMLEHRDDVVGTRGRRSRFRRDLRLSACACPAGPL
ncbi:MAG TPA: hypothetical protein VGI68_22475, partial [Mycobacterium sp.]